MKSEQEYIALLKHLEVTMITLEHYSKTNPTNVALVNLQYTKKFMYEQWEYNKNALEAFRKKNDPNSPLASTIRGGSLNVEQALEAIRNL
jgi:hypothetical protein